MTSLCCTVYPPRDPERQGTAPNEREMEWAESLHSDVIHIPCHVTVLCCVIGWLTMLVGSGGVLMQDWESILPISTLKPGHPETAHNYFDINSEKRWTHLRVNLFPGVIIMLLAV